MDGRESFAGTWTLQLQGTTLMLLLRLIGLDSKIHGQ